MKYLIYLIALALTPLIFWSNRIIPRDKMTGEIIQISDPIAVPLPHREAIIRLEIGETKALTYESAISYKIGDLVRFHDDNGVTVVTEKYRLPSLVSLFALFVLVVVLVSGWHGLRSLLGLAFSFVIIFQFVLPQIVVGSNPIVVALLASIVILSVSYSLSHGINTKSVVAIIGTLISLIITGILASLYGSLAGLTGLGSEEAGFLLDTLPKESFYKLLLAGVIVGSLGVLDDVTISQASIVEELRLANRKLGFADLYHRAMNIGHDHIASVVNTMVLVYAGSSLPLLLLFLASELGYIDLLNYEALAEEIVRTLVASIGLVSAVPVTTILAAYWYSGKR